MDTLSPAAVAAARWEEMRGFAMPDRDIHWHLSSLGGWGGFKISMYVRQIFSVVQESHVVTSQCLSLAHFTSLYPCTSSLVDVLVPRLLLYAFDQSSVCVASSKELETTFPVFTRTGIATSQRECTEKCRDKSRTSLEGFGQGARVSGKRGKANTPANPHPPFRLPLCRDRSGRLPIFCRRVIC